MFLSSQTMHFALGLEISDIKTLLVFLYKLIKFSKKLLSKDNYQYNYDYVSPLALTGAPPLPGIKIAVPFQELPNPKWVFLVIHNITLVVVNDALSKLSNFIECDVSYGWDDNAESNKSVLDGKVQTLEYIDKEIKDAESQKDLEEVALKLASITQEITEQLVGTGADNVSFGMGTTSEIEERLREIDEEFELYELNANENTEELSFSLPSDSEDSTTNLLNSAFKDIIKFNVELLNLESTQTLPQELDFSTGASTMGPSLEDYNKLFTKISLPQISSRFQEDLVFAYMQVAGPNPLMLQQVSEQDNPLQITNEQYQEVIGKIIGTSDSLEAAMREGRLYKADYCKLKDMENGNFPNQQKYIYSPLALFTVPPSGSPSRSLIPVAIQCQHPSVPENPVFTPLNGDNWMVAKSIVQMADSNYHELVSHLGRTHLFVEPFAIATKRQLPKNHHLRILLEPHFEGTIFINYGAHQILIADKGGVDTLLASTIQSDRNFAVQGSQDYLQNFNDAMFPNILASRGVERMTQLPDYPYRDDGLLIWNAIHKWVRSYLSSYYTSVQQLLEDRALQNWAKELVSDQGGRLQNFGEDADTTIKTLDYLIDAVSTIIFTASAQHAAVNFPQGELMTYAPAFPLASYSPAPTNPDQPGNFMSMLPSLEQAKKQIKLTYLLGSVYYTQLGQYSNSYFKSTLQVSSSLRTFQNELKGIEEEINQKNRTSSSRIMPYKFLLPSEIPQSINI